MKKLVKNTENSWLPDYFAENTGDIDFVYLEMTGIKACFFDLDHTIVVQHANDFDERTLAMLKSINMDVFIATNRRYSPDLDKIVSKIGAKGIVHSESLGMSKPSGDYYKKVIKVSGVEPHQIVMIGDRLVQDGWGAKRMDITTVMVGKLGKIKWYGYFNSFQDILIPKLFRDSYIDV